MPNTAISLFSGAGGCSLGFKQAGFDVLLAVEKDADAVATYQNNFPETKLLHEDITRLNARDILLKAGIKRGELSFLIGGPPCQGFSSAGTRFLDDPRNKLVKHYVKFLDEIKPKWFLMENVEGLLTAGGGEYFPQLAQSFLDSGYSIQVHKIYSHWHGLPQKRKRVFIIGNSGDLDFTMPSITHIEGQNLLGKPPILSLLDAVSDLPPPASSEERKLKYAHRALNAYQKSIRGDVVIDHWTPKLEDDALERVKLLKQGQSMKDLPPHLQHPSFQRRAKRRVMDGTPTEKRGGAPSGVKRLRSTDPCLTITSAAPREFIHPTQNRFITIRECARVQSFPDSFIFRGSAQSRIQQISNAIPPLIARTIAEHIMGQNLEVDQVNLKGRLLDYSLTKADAMSPVLKKVDKALKAMKVAGDRQVNPNEESKAYASKSPALTAQ